MAFDPELYHSSTYINLTEDQELRLARMATSADAQHGQLYCGTGIHVRTMLPQIDATPEENEPLVQIFEYDLDCSAACTFSVTAADARKLAAALLREADAADRRQVQPSILAVLDGVV